MVRQLPLLLLILGCALESISVEDPPSPPISTAPVRPTPVLPAPPTPVTEPSIDPVEPDPVPAAKPCTEVAHIGDSLSAYCKDSITSAYTQVGASAVISAYGGRAVLQKLKDDPETGKNAALRLRGDGFTGCWVVALGTNDAANIAAGANYSHGKVIDEMLTAIDPAKTARVLWVNVHTTRTEGYNANAEMQKFNRALEEAPARWPNLRVFDWASVAASGVAPYADGIHHTGAGSNVRNERVAQALQKAF
ncbi:MAG: hypothetical protein A2284_01785 [Deltaproteobacteria bacterium RIFOXYA12_FULL_61_11]|nr:MAG: hypothetical protein A2284_01785 [Deltaproteobacteria bacterium RIFOXYA12_FULL_61_11]